MGKTRIEAVVPGLKGKEKFQEHPVLRRNRTPWGDGGGGGGEEGGGGTDVDSRSSPPPQLLHSFRTLRTNRLVRPSPISGFLIFFIISQINSKSCFKFIFKFTTDFEKIAFSERGFPISNFNPSAGRNSESRAPRVDESAARSFTNTKPTSFPLRSSNSLFPFSLFLPILLSLSLLPRTPLLLSSRSDTPQIKPVITSRLESVFQVRTFWNARFDRWLWKNSA